LDAQSTAKLAHGHTGDIEQGEHGDMTSINDILAGEQPAFARAVKAVITGDVSALRQELLAEPPLVHARSRSAHHATLLHYTAANGIEAELQHEVSNADEIARILLDAGAEPDAPCDAYEGKCPTTLNLLVSSDHPNQVGVASRLIAVLCSRGACVDGVERDGSPLATALYFANVDSVDALLVAGARTQNVIFAAAAGNTDWVHGWLDGNRQDDRRSVPASFPLSSDRRIAGEQALVFASMCGRIDLVRLLVACGVDVNSSPPGSFRTGAALHTAAIQGQVGVVRFLLEHGADPRIKDARYQGTALDWTKHVPRRRSVMAQEIAALLA
jgi:ankyrin repeat protein